MGHPTDAVGRTAQELNRRRYISASSQAPFVHLISTLGERCAYATGANGQAQAVGTCVLSDQASMGAGWWSPSSWRLLLRVEL